MRKNNRRVSYAEYEEKSSRRRDEKKRDLSRRNARQNKEIHNNVAIARD